jgi:hypothetical protein
MTFGRQIRKSKSVKVNVSISPLEKERLNPTSGITRLGVHYRLTAVPVQELLVLVLSATE